MSIGQKGGENVKPLLSQLSTKSPAPAASTTPVPLTTPSDPQPRTESSDPSDWSSHAPRRVSERQLPLTASGIFTGKPAYNPVHIDTALHSAAPASPLYSPALARPPSAAPTSLPGLSPRHQRSMSAMSFSGPRSAEITPAVKRMKQLALLESVADESARMTPTLEQQRLRTNPEPPMMHGYNSYPAMPRPSTSVPTMQTMHQSFANRPMLYSADRMGNMPPARVPSVPVPTMMPPLSSAITDDPFKVRPRNVEMAAHMQPPHYMHARVRQSMNETQLAPMLQRQPIHAPSPFNSQVQPPPPGAYVISPPPVMYTPHYPQQIPARGSPSHFPIPQAYSPAPASAPAMAPHFENPHLSHPHRNSQLLSILNANANGPNRNPMSSINTPVGVVNGIEHR